MPCADKETINNHPGYIQNFSQGHMIMRENSFLIKQRNWKRIIGIVLLVTLILSIVYAIVRIIYSPSEAAVSDVNIKVKSDYVLMLLQCLLGLTVMAIPSIVERKWSIDIPNYMEVLYFVFLYCAIFLGEVRDFYNLVPYWDTVLHAFSGAMLGALGFSLVSFLNEAEQLDIELSPFFLALFSFCFALSVGVAWEIYEFVFDGILSLNMQKYALPDGSLLAGHAALADTMKDIIVDAVSALIIAVIGYLTIKGKVTNLSEGN
jgi:hypothetical protein